MWFAHSMVNGVDFWNEGTGDAGRSPKEKGKTVHDALVETTSGAVGVLSARIRWVAPDSKLICTDDRTLRFRGTSEARMIDYEVTLHALPDAPLLLGDNKDGTMAMRLAQWMTMPHKSQGGGTNITGDAANVLSASASHGHIVTSTDKRDADAWGK